MAARGDSPQYSSGAANPSRNCFLFVNPASGSYSSHRLEQIMAALDRHGLTPVLFSVRTPAEVLDCCPQVNRAGQPLVIIAAGDGTINCVVNGLESGTATIAILPFGTSNVLAAELGIDSVETGIARIIAGRTEQLSIGLLELTGLTRRFVLMAGIGLDGAVVRGVRPLAKKFLKQGGYAVSALCQAINWDRSRFDVHLPQGKTTCHSAIVCNAARYGGNFLLAPHRTLFADGFEVITFGSSKRRDYLTAAWELFSGKAANSGVFARQAAAVLEITGNKPIQLDGDFVGCGPGRISKIAKFAKIII